MAISTSERFLVKSKAIWYLVLLEIKQPYCVTLSLKVKPYNNVYKDIFVFLSLKMVLKPTILGSLMLEVIKPCFSNFSSKRTPHLGQ